MPFFFFFFTKGKKPKSEGEKELWAFLRVLESVAIVLNS